MKNNRCRTCRFVVLLMALLMISLNCSEKRRESGRFSEKLQALVDGVVCHDGEDPIHNAVLLVESPKTKWKGAAGLADGKKEAMTAEHTIKIASIGKTFTAAVILQLFEEGRLKLADTMDKFLDNPVVQLDKLHWCKGISYGRRITVEQLLSHTSGIADYMEDDRFVPDVLANPKLQYNPARIMGIYYQYQTNGKALFPPGAGFNYSDINYVLLAMVIERVSGESYQRQLEKRLFNPLGMANSYLEHYQPPRGRKPLSHAFIGTLDLVDDVHTSFDWGGGGIVSTAEELNGFFRALLGGKLFRRRSTLERMLAAADKGRGGSDYAYGLGIMKRSIHGMTFYGHGGAYDCDAFYCPDKDISVVMSLNQMNTHGKRDQFLQQAIELVR